MPTSVSLFPGSFPPCSLQTFTALADLSAPSSTTLINILYNKGKMLHREREPAVSYPKFPGNVEALSISVGSPMRRSSYESSSPSPSSSTASTTPISPPPPTTTTQTQTLEPNQPSKPKRRQTLAACHPCRKRRSRVCASLAARRHLKQDDCCMFPS